MILTLRLLEIIRVFEAGVGGLRLHERVAMTSREEGGRESFKQLIGCEMVGVSSTAD